MTFIILSPNLPRWQAQPCIICAVTGIECYIENVTTFWPSIDQELDLASLIFFQKERQPVTRTKIRYEWSIQSVIVIHFRFLPDLTYITLNAQCVHPMLVKKTQAVTRVGLEPTTLPVATGWFEYIEQWVLRTIFQRWFFASGSLLFILGFCPTWRTCTLHWMLSVFTRCLWKKNPKMNKGINLKWITNSLT